MFKVGDLVKVDEKELPFLGIEEGISGLLVINDTEDWHGREAYEVKNSDGNTFQLLGNALVSV